jgi:hypothetical protein
MGRYSFSWALGMLAGPIIGGLLENFGFTILFSTYLAVGIPAFIIALYAMHFSYQPKNQPTTNKTTTPSKDVAPTHLHHVYLIIIMYSIVMSLIFSIFPAYAEDLSMDAFQIGILFFTLRAARVITLWHSEGITRIGEKQSTNVSIPHLWRNHHPKHNTGNHMVKKENLYIRISQSQPPVVDTILDNKDHQGL